MARSAFAMKMQKASSIFWIDYRNDEHQRWSELRIGTHRECRILL